MMRRVLAALRPVAAVAAVGALGGWMAVLAVGPLRYDVGPFRVDVFARPGTGITEIGLPPFGRVLADTHTAPVHLTARLNEVRPQEASDLLEERGTDGLIELVEDGARAAVAGHARRALLIAVLGGLLAGFAVFRLRWRPVLGAGLASLMVAVSGAVVARSTFRPEAFEQPTFTGSLTEAPRLLGPIREAPGRLEVFRADLERIVSGAVRAYGVVSAPVPSQSRIVALHISDVHASPVGMDVAQQLAGAFQVDLVIDTGDITSFNSPAERTVLDRIPQFGVPYVFVRGNHDSPGTAAELAAIDGVTVLDGEATDVAGLRIFGVPDPEFTPANPERASEEGRLAILEAHGRELAFQLGQADPPADVLAVHDDRLAQPVAGLVPLVLSGHFHRFDARARQGTIYIRAGTTGAGGFDPFPEGVVKPISAEILYLDGTPPRLVALDSVQLNPETRDLAVTRILAQTLLDQEVPVPGPSPTG